MSECVKAKPNEATNDEQKVQGERLSRLKDMLASLENAILREEMEFDKKAVKALRDEVRQELRLKTPPRITRRKGETPECKRNSRW